VLSSEALAVSAKCPEWKVIFMSTINGAGALTAKSWNRYFFRINTSGPMGARAVSLYLIESPMKRFFGLGSDYAWGRDSVASFEKLITGAGKEIVGKDYPPVGTKDFASYIAKVKQSGAQGCYLVLVGQDATIFFKQASQFGLTREVKPIMEILELENMKAVGDAMAGAIGGSRYPFTVDTPKNHDFVKRFHEMHGVYPDMFDGETYEGVEWLAQVIQKAGTADDVEKVIEAWEDSPYEGLEGSFFMRKCDHQAVQPGFVVEAAKDPKYPHLIPKIIGTYPGDKVTPKCRTEEFS
jgi:branched-chain amino acid transport system substrate-binding protein